MDKYVKDSYGCATTGEPFSHQEDDFPETLYVVISQEDADDDPCFLAEADALHADDGEEVGVYFLNRIAHKRIVHSVSE